MIIIDRNLCFRGMCYGNIPKLIVIHHVAAKICTIEDIHNWHLARGWAGCGYNYFIRKDGSIYRGRPDNAFGAHCINYNAKSLGVCLEGNFNIENFSHIQYKSLLELIRYLKKKYNIENIYAHRELNATYCLGKLFLLQKFKNIINPLNRINRNWFTYTNYLLKYNCYFRDINVLHVQKKLIEKGSTVGLCGADVFFGKATLQAVKKFQRDNGFMIDGIVGRDTWNRLFS